MIAMMALCLIFSGSSALGGGSSNTSRASHTADTHAVHTDSSSSPHWDAVFTSTWRQLSTKSTVSASCVPGSRLIQIAWSRNYGQKKKIEMYTCLISRIVPLWFRFLVFVVWCLKCDKCLFWHPWKDQTHRTPFVVVNPHNHPCRAQNHEECIMTTSVLKWITIHGRRLLCPLPTSRGNYDEIDVWHATERHYGASSHRSSLDTPTTVIKVNPMHVSMLG